MAISLLLPTRGRPGKMVRCYESIKNTVSNTNAVELVIVCDENDDETIVAAKKLYGLPTTIIIDEQKFAVEKWNDAAKRCTGDFICPIGDDIVFETKDWDIKILEEFKRWPSTIGLVYCDDNTWHGSMTTNFFISREWYIIAGLFPDGLRHNFSDRWFDDISNVIGRRVYRGDILLNHMHYAFNRSVENDETYAIQEPWKNHDKQYYNDTAHIRIQLAEKLKQRIQEIEKC